MQVIGYGWAEPLTLFGLLLRLEFLVPFLDLIPLTHLADPLRPLNHHERMDEREG